MLTLGSYRSSSAHLFHRIFFLIHLFVICRYPNVHCCRCIWPTLVSYSVIGSAALGKKALYIVFDSTIPYKRSWWLPSVGQFVRLSSCVASAGLFTLLIESITNEKTITHLSTINYHTIKICTFIFRCYAKGQSN